MSENSSVTSSIGATGKGFFEKLQDGDFGLAKTFWLYGALVSFIASIIMELTAIISIGFLAIIKLPYTVYGAAVIMGTWRAANKYEGPEIWAVLAKITAVLDAIMLIVGLIATFWFRGSRSSLARQVHPDVKRVIHLPTFFRQWFATLCLLATPRWYYLISDFK